MTLKFFNQEVESVSLLLESELDLELALAGRVCRSEAVPSSEPHLYRLGELSFSITKPCHCLENEPVEGEILVQRSCINSLIDLS